MSLAHASANSTVPPASSAAVQPGSTRSTTSSPEAARTSSTAASTTGSTPSNRTRPTVEATSEAAVNVGSRSRIPSATPATSRAIGPTVSSDGASGLTPSRGMRPCVVLSPTVPQQADGVRIDPAVSVPMATSASPRATATAEPLDDPPGIRAGSSGLTGVPKCGLIPVPPKASSCRLVFPITRAPAVRAVATQAASAAAGLARSATSAEPAVVGVPATSIRSLTASRGASAAGPAEPAGVSSMRRMKVVMGDGPGGEPPPQDGTRPQRPWSLGPRRPGRVGRTGNEPCRPLPGDAAAGSVARGFGVRGLEHLGHEPARRLARPGLGQVAALEPEVGAECAAPGQVLRPSVEVDDREALAARHRVADDLVETLDAQGIVVGDGGPVALAVVAGREPHVRVGGPEHGDVLFGQSVGEVVVAVA